MNKINQIYLLLIPQYTEDIKTAPQKSDVKHCQY